MRYLSLLAISQLRYLLWIRRGPTDNSLGLTQTQPTQPRQYSAGNGNVLCSGTPQASGGWTLIQPWPTAWSPQRPLARYRRHAVSVTHILLEFRQERFFWHSIGRVLHTNMQKHRMQTRVGLLQTMHRSMQDTQARRYGVSNPYCTTYYQMNLTQRSRSGLDA